MTAPDQRLYHNEQRTGKGLEVQTEVFIEPWFLLDTHGDLGLICRNT